MHLLSQAKIPVAKFIWRPGHGGFAFTVVCKATFELQRLLSPLSNQQEPIIEANEWTETGSLLRATDLVPFKKRPEVLLVGDAYAPEGRPVSSLVARLVMGEIDKSVLVVGDRYARSDGRVGEPGAFARMPLVWERATSGQNSENPVGKWVGSTGRMVASNWTLAPNLYPPNFDGTSPNMPVAPVGFAPISPLWPSRIECLKQHATGWDPLRWYDHPLPHDIDFAYFNAAPVDQQRVSPFADESIYLENLHPVFARMSTRLPIMMPMATVDQGAGPVPLKLRCDTLVIDTNRGLAMLVWRGHVVMEHADQPGHVVVTGPDLPVIAEPVQTGDNANETTLLVSARQTPPTVVLAAGNVAREAVARRGANEFTDTIVPTQSPKSAPAAALPFGKTATPPIVAVPPSANMARGAVVRPGANEFTDTIVPAQFTPKNPAVVLPFAKTTTSPISAASSFAQVAREAAARLPADEDGETMVPMPGQVFRAGAALPFAGASKEQAQPRVEPPPAYKAPIEAFTSVVPVGLGASMQLEPDKPATGTNVVPPVEEAVQEAKRADEPDAMETRLRTIQRAIWKGDRPIQEILTEHGLTELEWRAAKRASTRKSNT